MPIYIYECHDCCGEWKVSHGMSEEEEQCNWCESMNIGRKPSDFTLGFRKEEKKTKTGDLTRDFIKNSKDDLKQQKQDLNKAR